jgi:DNA-binding MarR family transcriptional regulator
MSKTPVVDFSTVAEVRDSCLCLFAQRAARRLARRFDLALKPTGLTNGQFSLLMSVNRPEPPPLTAVADLLGMDRTTVTAALKPLERRGLVEVRPDTLDRRSRRLALTEAGRTLLEQALPIWRETHAAVEAELAAAVEPQRLRQGLNILAGV